MFQGLAIETGVDNTSANVSKQPESLATAMDSPGSKELTELGAPVSRTAAQVISS